MEDTQWVSPYAGSKQMSRHLRSGADYSEHS